MDDDVSDGLWLVEDGEFTPIHTASHGESARELRDYLLDWMDFRDDFVRLFDDLEVRR